MYSLKKKPKTDKQTKSCFQSCFFESIKSVVLGIKIVVYVSFKLGCTLMWLKKKVFGRCFVLENKLCPTFFYLISNHNLVTKYSPYGKRKSLPNTDQKKRKQNLCIYLFCFLEIPMVVGFHQIK